MPIFKISGTKLKKLNSLPDLRVAETLNAKTIHKKIAPLAMAA